jgi:TolB-like protein
MSPQPAPASEPLAVPSRARSRRNRWIGAALLIVAIAASVAWYRHIPPIETVVVHPFADQTGRPWLAGAISEEIAATLRPVTKPTSELTAVLDGAVERAGDRVRITATLASPDGHRYWTRTFDRPITDAAFDIAAAIVPRVRKRNPRHKAPAKTYEQFLEARHQFQIRQFSEAAAEFERVADADPEFGLSWAWLAIAREHFVDLGGARPNDLLPGARDAAERAVTLEPNLAEPHLALGIVKLQYDWDWDGARRELDRAAELSPSDPLVARWRGHYLEAMNQAPVAVELPTAPRDPESARRLLADADNLREQTYVPAAALVLAATVAQDAESAVHWLYEAYDERSAQLPYLLRSPAIPRSDPRVLTLIHRLKLPTTRQ